MDIPEFTIQCPKCGELILFVQSRYGFDEKVLVIDFDVYIDCGCFDWARLGTHVIR